MKKIAIIILCGTIIVWSIACRKGSVAGAGTILSVTPDSGHFGTVVTIRGEGFDSINGYVTIDGVMAPISQISDTTIVLTVPTTHTGAILVKRTTGGSTAGPTFVYGDDILVAGWMNGSPCYWDNGVLFQLGGSSGYNTIASGVACSGDDVYVCGYSWYNNNNRYAMVWKNGTPEYLTTTTTPDAEAYTIQVSGQNVYVAGYRDTSNYDMATVWVNGQPTTLLGDTVNSYANAIAIVGNDVYIAGARSQSNGANNVALYWKNGTPVILSDGSTSANTTGIAVIGNDVYVAGNMGGGVLWVNGVAQSLTTPTTGLCSWGNDLYLSGPNFNCIPDWFNYFGGQNVNAITADNTGAYTANQSISNNVAVPSYTIWSSGLTTILLDQSGNQEFGSAMGICLRH